MGNASGVEGVPVSPVLVRSAEAAWHAYAIQCRLGGSPAERVLAYNNARVVEHRLWVAEGSEAARA